MKNEISCSICAKPMSGIKNFDKTCSEQCRQEVLLILSDIKPPFKTEMTSITIENFKVNLAEAKQRLENDSDYAEKILKPVWNNKGVMQKGEKIIFC